MPDTADLSRVTALSHKGHELAAKGHYARAAEKYKLAAEEAAKALPVPDCLVLCTLRFKQLHALLRHATDSAATPADAHDVLREACLRLLPSVMAVLDRRKAAGTLLPGCCLPAEEVYHTASARYALTLQGLKQAVVAQQAAVLAPYLGVDTYVRVAADVAFMLMNVDAMKVVFVISDEQNTAAYLFLASALDLMARPRDYQLWFPGEPGLVQILREVIPAVRDLDEPAAKQLCVAWQRLLRSGVLRARGIDEGIDQTNQRYLRTRAAADADLAAGRLQQCALSGCAAREAHASHFKRCGACRTVCYCCREHQVEDWPAHKAACKAARKGAEDPAGASSA